MNTGTLIKTYRTSKKLTQKQLGELCQPQIAESTIRRYELGTLNPKIETVQRIADALDIPLYKFYPDTVEISSAEFHIEISSTHLANDRIKRLIHYYSLLNDLGYSKLEQHLHALIKDPKYLK